MDRNLTLPAPARSAPAVLALVVWLALAIGIAASGALTLERRFVIPITMAGLLVMQVLAYRRSASVRALGHELDMRWLVLFHAVRAPIGAAFLALMAHGLDATFARVAGIGDLVAGTGALVVGLFASRVRPLVLVWNLFGLADILAVVFTAQRILIFSDHPQTMQMLVHFPGTLLPTFLVPLIIAVHLLVLVRLRAAGRTESA